MNDRYAQFLIMLEEVCESARLAEVPIELHTRDGAVHLGVPKPPPAAVLSAPMPGATAQVAFAHELVELGEVTAFSVAEPAARDR